MPRNPRFEESYPGVVNAKRCRHNDHDYELETPDHTGHCACCERITSMVSVAFETYVCSPKCADVLWREVSELMQFNAVIYANGAL